MFTIATLAVPLSGNKGSASMLEGLVDGAMNAFGDDVHFNVLTYYPERDSVNNSNQQLTVFSGTPLKLLFGIFPFAVVYFLFSLVGVRLPVKFFPSDARAIIEADVVLEVGGTTFTDAKLIKVSFNLLNVAIPLLFRKKTIKASQTMGPFNNIVNRMAAKISLPYLQKNVGRGRISEKHLKALGLKNATYFADLSFMMEIDDQERQKMVDAYGQQLAGKKPVGISPNSIVEKYCKENNLNHAKIFGDFINYLVENNYYPVIIPHSYRKESQSRHNNDYFTIEEIKEHIMQPDSCLFVEEDYSPQELRALIGMMDLYVASRFHSMISALAMEVPCFVLGWGNQKYHEVLNEFDVAAYYDSYKNLTTKTLVDGFELVVKDYDEIKKSIGANLPKVCASAQEHIELLKKFQ